MEKEKKNLVPNSIRSRPGQENSKKKKQKIKKKSFRHYFYRNRDEIGREREKNLVSNYDATRPGIENSKKIR